MGVIRKRLYNEEGAINYLLNEFHVTSALWRFCEFGIYKDQEIEKPVLDLGCGDGAFAKQIFAEPIDAGIDISDMEIRKAANLQLYKDLRTCSATALPYEDESFKTIFSNCAIEHIPDIDKVLQESWRVLQNGGAFLFTVPTIYFNEFLLYPGVLRKLGLSKVADIYLKIVNKALQHHNLFPECVWKEKLFQHGFRVEEKKYFVSSSAMRLIDLLNFTKPIIMFNLLVFRRRCWFVPRKIVKWLFKEYILKEAKREVAKGGGLFIKALKEPKTYFKEQR